MIAKLEENEVDEDELIEQRRRKRQELMKKLQEEKQQAGTSGLASSRCWRSTMIRPYEKTIQ